MLRCQDLLSGSTPISCSKFQARPWRTAHEDRLLNEWCWRNEEQAAKGGNSFSAYIRIYEECSALKVRMSESEANQRCRLSNRIGWCVREMGLDESSDCALSGRDIRRHTLAIDGHRNVLAACVLHHIHIHSSGTPSKWPTSYAPNLLLSGPAALLFFSNNSMFGPHFFPTRPKWIILSDITITQQLWVRMPIAYTSTFMCLCKTD